MISIVHRNYHPGIREAVRILKEKGRDGQTEARIVLSDVLSTANGTDLRHMLGELHDSLKDLRHNLNRAHKRTVHDPDASVVAEALGSAERCLDHALTSLHDLFEKEVDIEGGRIALRSGKLRHKQFNAAISDAILLLTREGAASLPQVKAIIETISKNDLLLEHALGRACSELENVGSGLKDALEAKNSNVMLDSLLFAEEHLGPALELLKQAYEDEIELV